MNAFKKYFVALIAALALFGGFQASAQTTASTNYTGMWCTNCDVSGGEAGWGMQLVDHGTNMFVAWYGYGPNEKPFWFTVSGGTFSPDKRTFTGALYVTTGPSHRLPTFDRNLVTIRQAGNMTLVWSDATTATLSYTVDGVSVVKSIKKYIFSTPPFAFWPNNNSDMWCKGCETLTGEAGWGMTIEQQGDQMFLAFFVYGDDGQPFWFTVSGGSWTTDKSFTGMLWTTTGSSYTNPVFDGSRVTIAPAGTATLLFKDRETATLTYTVNCTTVTKEINRYHFVPNEQIGGTMFKPSKLSAFVLAAGIAGCGGGGGGSGPSTGPAAATVAITQVTPANGATNVSIDTKPSITFQVANGSYLSHTADFRCGGNPVAHTPSVSGSTSGSITLNPSSPQSLLGQTCQVNWTVNGTPSGNPGAQMTQSWSYASVSVPAKLLLPIGVPSLNSGQSLMVIDLTTGTLSSGGIPWTTSVGCEAGNLRSDGLVRIACTIGGNYWDYNPVTNTVTQNTTLTKLPSATWSPVVSSPSGTDYYGVGGNSGGGQVLVRNGNSFTGAIDVSSKALQYVNKVLGDFPSGKLYTLNQNLNQVTNPATLPAHVDRIDIATSKVEATYTDAVPGLGLALYNGELYMAKYRDGNGMDVVKFNTTTFQKTGEGKVVGVTGNGGVQYVFSIAVDTNGVHLGVSGGIQTLSHDLKTVTRTATATGTGLDLFAYNNKLYVIGFAGGNDVFEVDSATGNVLRSWNVNGNPYRPTVVGN